MYEVTRFPVLTTTERNAGTFPTGFVILNSTSNQFEVWSGAVWTAQGSANGFQFFASAQVVTDSAVITGGTFVNFDNSPALSFTPTITGTYKVYSPITMAINSSNNAAATRVVLTSGAGTLLYESQGLFYATSVVEWQTIFTQSVYTLTSGVAYVFDIQAYCIGAAGNINNKGSQAPFYMFAELCG